MSLGRTFLKPQIYHNSTNLCFTVISRKKVALSCRIGNHPISLTCTDKGHRIYSCEKIIFELIFGFINQKMVEKSYYDGNIFCGTFLLCSTNKSTNLNYPKSIFFLLDKTMINFNKVFPDKKASEF